MGGSSPKVPKPAPPPNPPTTATAIGRNPIGAGRRFDLPGVFTSSQGLERKGGRRSLIGGNT